MVKGKSGWKVVVGENWGLLQSYNCPSLLCISVRLSLLLWTKSLSDDDAPCHSVI